MGLEPDEFRVLCKNGSLAATTGFNNITKDCALTPTIDAEIVIRKDCSQKLSIQLALEEFDDKFGYLSHSLIIKLYEPFRGVPDLLFKVTLIFGSYVQITNNLILFSFA